MGGGELIYGILITNTNQNEVAIALAVGVFFSMKKCMNKKSTVQPAAISLPVARPRAPLDEMARAYPKIADQLGAIAQRVEKERDDWSSPAGSSYYEQQQRAQPGMQESYPFGPPRTNEARGQPNFSRGDRPGPSTYT